MGVPDNVAVPASLAFLADEATMEKSFDQYLAGTDRYRAKLKQWEEDKKQNPDLKPPEPSEVLNDSIGTLLEFDLFGQPDHLTVRLALSSPPFTVMADGTRPTNKWSGNRTLRGERMRPISRFSVMQIGRNPTNTSRRNILAG